MPNRLLKEGICTSDAVNLLSSDSEVLFYRLLVVSDDFGNMDGRPAIIKSMCFPLKESVTTKLIKTWLIELENATLIQRYKTPDEKQYISILKWNQRQRSNAKYPLPTDSNVLTSDSQTSASGLGLGLGLGKGKGKGKGDTYTPLERLVSFKVRKRIAKDWIALRNKQKAPVTETVINSFKREAGKANKTLEEVLVICIENSWRGFKAEWLEDNGAGQPKATNSDWQETKNGIREKGVELGMPMKPGEPIQDYRRRLMEKEHGIHNSN